MYIELENRLEVLIGIKALKNVGWMTDNGNIEGIRTQQISEMFFCYHDMYQMLKRLKQMFKMKK